jgi:hypothetical protein
MSFCGQKSWGMEKEYAGPGDKNTMNNKSAVESLSMEASFAGSAGSVPIKYFPARRNLFFG